MERKYDVIIIGAGAAGLFAAYLLSGLKLKTAILEKRKTAGLKLLASGGGKCNFSNRTITADNYICENPRFPVSALAGFSTGDFIKILEINRINYEEREFGRLFLKQDAVVLKELFEKNIAKSKAEIFFGCEVKNIINENGGFKIDTLGGIYRAANVILASGGLPLGGSDFCLKAAKDLGLKTIPARPALTPLNAGLPLELAGQSLTVKISVAAKEGKIKAFTDGVVFTHGGFGGPAAYQASLYLKNGGEIEADFLPSVNLEAALMQNKHKNISAEKFLAQYLPKKLAAFFSSGINAALPNCKKEEINRLINAVKKAKFSVSLNTGYSHAEVMAGGISTDEFSSKTMESKNIPGFYALGEALDVTGQLGGYNLHWAWASANACVKHLKQKYNF